MRAVQGRMAPATALGALAALGAVAAVALALGAAAAVLGAGPRPAAADEVGERVRALRPKPEGWQEVPWRTDLAAARREAARTSRPLFLWAMNGNPLGCT